MSDESQLQVRRHKDDESSLVLSSARSSLVARGRMDAAALAARARPQSEEELLLEKTRRLAEQGDAAAQAQLGAAYLFGQGVEQDDAEAIKWCRKAAEQGIVDAQLNLGLVYASEGVEQDYGEAVKWYRKAAEQGSPWAQLHLGQMYEMGLGIPHDDAEAVSWYRKAAQLGNVCAQEALARLER